jgi:hypothetical protein
LHPGTGKVVTNKTIKLVDTRKALEGAIIQRNRRHFAQAKGTPFTEEPLSRIGAENEYNVHTDSDGQEIRTPDNSFIEIHTVMELRQARHLDPSMGWSETALFDEFISGFLHWNENTSTSPSSRHLGLYRASVTAYCNSSGEFWDLDPQSVVDLSTQEMAEAILEMIHGLSVTATRQGFYL